MSTDEPARILLMECVVRVQPARLASKEGHSLILVLGGSGIYLDNRQLVTTLAEKSLGFQTSLALAALTSQAHLLRTTLTAFQVCLSNVRQSSDEDRTSVQALCSFDPWVAFGIFVHNLLIDLI
jgi:hypothetical protein